MIRLSLLIVCFCVHSLLLFAQSSGGFSIPIDPLKLLPKTGTIEEDTIQKRTIEIINSNFLEQESDTITHVVKRILNGNVVLLHEGAVMKCDSAILYPNTNYLEAIGHVKITKGDSIDIRSETLKYDGNTKLAILENNVRLKDKTSILTAPYMTYEVDKEIGHFFNNGKLTTDSTTLTSQYGTNFQKESYAVFYGDVVLKNPDYTMLADSMKYNTESKIAYFIAPTTIISDEDTIITNDGYFDTKSNTAFLKGRPIIKNGTENTLQSDSIHYDKEKGTGIAIGNVVSINKKENITLLANHVYHADSNQFSIATQDPLMIQIDDDEKDTLYISADTLINYSVPLSEFTQIEIDSTADSAVSGNEHPSNDTSEIEMIQIDTISKLDSTKILPSKDTIVKIEPKVSTDSSAIQDSILAVDSTSTPKSDSVKVFFGYRNVKLIRSNLSGICDSIYFNSRDSIFKLYYQPVLWMDSTQMKADSIYIFMKDEKADKIELYQNAIIIDENDSGVFQQIAGKKITGWLKNDQIKHVLVDGNAECIYFLKNDSNEYMGGNRTKSALIHITFNDSSDIDRIKLEISPEAVFTPIQQINFSSYKLDAFNWYWSLKPKSKWDVIRDTVQYQKFALEHPEAVDTNVLLLKNEFDSTISPPSDTTSIEKTPQTILKENPTENKHFPKDLPIKNTDEKLLIDPKKKSKFKRK